MPYELQLVMQCKRRNALPGPGGILDQEAWLLERMAICEDAFYTVLDYKRQPAGTGSKWAARNPHGRQLIVDLMYGD